MPVTKLGVSAENVQATIETPNNHQGMDLPPKKNSSVLFPAVLDAIHPIPRTTAKNRPMMMMSMVAKIMIKYSIKVGTVLHFAGKELHYLADNLNDIQKINQFLSHRCHQGSP
jgi:hypothetical protein